MELAHKYIDGLATDAEIVEIRNRLKSDSKFRKEFMRLQAMKAMLAADERVDSMRTEMGDLFDKVVTPKLTNKESVKPTRVISLQRFAFATAAAVSLLLIATFVFNQRGVDGNSLYTAHYEPYSSSMVRGNEKQEVQYQEGIKQYNQGNYALAEQHLLKYVESLTASDQLEKQLGISYLLLGNCALNQDNVTKAEEYFNLAIAKSNAQYIQDAKWYLAMTHLKSGDEDAAKAHLDAIANSMNIYQVEAKKILKEWNK